MRGEDRDKGSNLKDILPIFMLEEGDQEGNGNITIQRGQTTLKHVVIIGYTSNVEGPVGINIEGMERNATLSHDGKTTDYTFVATFTEGRSVNIPEVNIYSNDTVTTSGHSQVSKAVEVMKKISEMTDSGVSSRDEVAYRNAKNTLDLHRQVNGAREVYMVGRSYPEIAQQYVDEHIHDVHQALVLDNGKVDVTFKDITGEGFTATGVPTVSLRLMVEYV